MTFPTPAPPLKGKGSQLHPRRRVVRRLLLTPRPFIDTRALQPVRRLGRTKQMVEPKPQVPLPAAGGIVPESVELLLIGVQRAQRVGPALVDDPPPYLPRLRLHHRVVRGRARR